MSSKTNTAGITFSERMAELSARDTGELSALQLEHADALSERSSRPPTPPPDALSPTSSVPSRSKVTPGAVVSPPKPLDRPKSSHVVFCPECAEPSAAGCAICSCGAMLAPAEEEEEGGDATRPREREFTGEFSDSGSESGEKAAPGPGGQGRDGAGRPDSASTQASSATAASSIAGNGPGKMQAPILKGRGVRGTTMLPREGGERGIATGSSGPETARESVGSARGEESEP
eukprot:3163717-Rhodomonas_salina.2